MEITRTRSDLRAAVDHQRKTGHSIGFVPTMGALHDGHISLVRRALEASDCVVASIFVNPTQFAPGEDFDAYPRPEKADLEKLEAAGCRVVYQPDARELYPEGSKTNVRVEGMSDLLDGIHRPHFFYGVTTVVSRLFVHVAPDVAVFGEKDFQQLQIIRRMVSDLGFPIRIIGGQTVRDADGLAQSSRNAYLSEAERKIAGALFRALLRTARRVDAGTPVAQARQEAIAHLERAGFDRVDYVSVVNSETLIDLPDGPVAPGDRGRVLGAARTGNTRLIDNLPFSRPFA